MAAGYDVSFNSRVDHRGSSQGDRFFEWPSGFAVRFTDDNSVGSYRGEGQASGVHITNPNYGNVKVGSASDFVLGAYNQNSGSNNYHSSGTAAHFGWGASRVSLFDSDDDSTMLSDEDSAARPLQLTKDESPDSGATESKETHT